MFYRMSLSAYRENFIMGFSKKIIALVLAGSIAFQYADLDFAAYFDSAHYHTVTFLSDSDGCTLEPGLEEDPDFAEAWIRSADAADDENIETPSEIGTSSDAIPADLSNKEIPATISEIPSTSEIPDQSGRSGTENHLQKIQICVPDGECMAFNEIPEPVLQEGYKFNGWENHQEVYNEDEILDIPVYEDIPDLSGNKDIFSRNIGNLQCASDFLFISIYRCRVYMPVACIQCPEDSLLGCLSLAGQIDTQP